MWLDLGVEIMEFYFEGCSLGVSSDSGWLWTVFIVFVSVKVSVLGGDVFWWVIFKGFI